MIGLVGVLVLADLVLREMKSPKEVCFAFRVLFDLVKWMLRKYYERKF